VETFLKTFQKLAKVELLILDDLCLAPLSNAVRKGLLEINEDGYQQTSIDIKMVALLNANTSETMSGCVLGCLAK